MSLMYKAFMQGLVGLVLSGFLVSCSSEMKKETRSKIPAPAVPSEDAKPIDDLASQNDNQGDQSPTSENQQASSGIEFTFLESESSDLAEDIKNITDIVVTVVKKEDESIVFEMKKLQVMQKAEGPITAPLSLIPGEYQVTEFQALDKDGETLFVAPKDGSLMASLVTQTLPKDFEISKDAVTKVSLQVLSTLDRLPSDFGYLTFGIEIVERLDFLVAAFAYDSDTANFLLTEASLVVEEDGQAIFSGDLEAKTNQITIADQGETNYKLIANKEGYKTWEMTLTAKELKAAFDDPIEIVFEEGDAGSASGTVTDSKDKSSLENVKVEVKGEDEFVVALTYTDSQGKYSFASLTPGTYMMCFSLEGYESTCIEGTIVKDEEITVNAELTAESDLPELVEITLTWGEEINDLDSYLHIFGEKGEEEFLVYYIHALEGSQMEHSYVNGTAGFSVDLDRDARTPSGSETISIKMGEFNGSFAYSVRNRVDAEGLSSAKVTVKIDGEIIQEITYESVAPEQGTPETWNVLELDAEGKMTLVNTFQ